MNAKTRFIHATFLILLPVLVAALGLGVVSAAALVIGMLVWRWLIVLSAFRPSRERPAIVLETIAASHFVEKVRWCMDRLELDYAERQSAGTLGAFFTGRTVPQLKVQTGLVQSVIGNSPEILRYLWGAYAGALGERATFLQPTDDRLELEGRLDRYGRNLQVWIYYHLLPDRALTLHAWGCDSPHVPAWQRLALRLLFPLQALMIRRAFSISDDHFAKSVLRIEELLSEIDTRLADGRGSILGGDQLNYTDIAFAALSGIWIQPEGYAGDKGKYVRIERDDMPKQMRADVERWLEDYPRATMFVDRLYANDRRPPSQEEETT